MYSEIVPSGFKHPANQPVSPLSLADSWRRISMDVLQRDASARHSVAQRFAASAAVLLTNKGDSSHQRTRGTKLALHLKEHYRLY